jgi:hypothetical protein
MNVTNEQQEDTPLLTHTDLAIAAFSISEVFNSYLEKYEEEDYGELTKEQMELSMNNLRTAFVKYDSLIKVISERQDDNEGG